MLNSMLLQDVFIEINGKTYYEPHIKIFHKGRTQLCVTTAVLFTDGETEARGGSLGRPGSHSLSGLDLRAGSCWFGVCTRDDTHDRIALKDRVSEARSATAAPSAGSAARAGAVLSPTGHSARSRPLPRDSPLCPGSHCDPWARPCLHGTGDIASQPARQASMAAAKTLLVSGSDGPSPRAAPGPARPQTCTGILWRGGGGPPVPAAPSPAHSP